MHEKVDGVEVGKHPLVKEFQDLSMNLFEMLAMLRKVDIQALSYFGIYMSLLES